MKGLIVRYGMVAVVAVLGIAASLGLRAAPTEAAQKSKCISCHEKVTPGVVTQFLSGKMGKTLDCSTCHGSDHQTEKDVAKVKLPTPETCAQCHEKRVKEYREGKHALAWVSMKRCQ